MENMFRVGRGGWAFYAQVFKFIAKIGLSSDQRAHNHTGTHTIQVLETNNHKFYELYVQLNNLNSVSTYSKLTRLP